MKYCSRYLTEYVMYVVVKGSLVLNVNMDTVTLEAGDVYLFREGDQQGTAMLRSNRSGLADFAPERADFYRSLLPNNEVSHNSRQVKGLRSKLLQ